MISLKPPVVPRPSIGGAPNADTMAPRTSSRQRSCSCCGDGVGAQLGAVPLSNAFEQDVHRAEVGRVGVQDQRLAGDADRVLDARRVAGQVFSMRAMIRSRALHRGGSRAAAR